MGKLKTLQTQVQEAIEKGIATVEEQHKAIANKSFDYVEKVEAEAKSYSVKTLRDLHNDTVNGLYEAVRAFNKRLGEVTGDLLAKVEKEDVAAEAEAKPAAKKAAKKPAAKKEEAEAEATA